MKIHTFGSELSIEAITRLLLARDIQPTQQRLKIAQVMFAAPQHLSAEQVLAKVEDKSVHVSKATVYNTLGLFVERGLINQVVVDPQRIFYDSNTEPHYHFYNVDTGTLVDVDPACIPVAIPPTLPDGTEMAGVEVIVRVRQKNSGVC